MRSEIEGLTDALLEASRRRQQQDSGDAARPPLRRSYRVEPGRLLAGVYPGSRDRDEAASKLGCLLGRPRAHGHGGGLLPVAARHGPG